MSQLLGIVVATDKHLDHLINISRAAKDKGKEVLIFFTHKGVLLTQDPRFAELEPLAEMSLCNVSFEYFNLDKNVPIPGIPESAYATQARHGDLIERCDRYLVL